MRVNAYLGGINHFINLPCSHTTLLSVFDILDLKGSIKIVDMTENIYNNEGAAVFQCMGSACSL